MRRDSQLFCMIALVTILTGCNTNSTKPSVAICDYLPETTRPNWTNETNIPGYYVGIGIAEFSSGEKEQRQRAYDDALSNLATSITANVFSSTNTEIKEVNGQVDSRASIMSEVTSQLSLESVDNDVWWLDRRTCQLWTRAKITKEKGDSLRDAQKRDRMDSVEVVLWSQIKESDDIRDFRMYLSAFERGKFSDIAKTKLRELEIAPPNLGAQKKSKIDKSFIEKAQILANEDKKEWQIALALIFAHGEGVKQDFHKAEKWLNKAISLGSARANYELGILLRKKKDLDRAVEVLERSKNYKFSDSDTDKEKIEGWIYYHLSTLELGDIYYFDLKDYSTAYRYYSLTYEESSDSFVDEYQAYALGFHKYYGQGTERDESTGIALFEKSANKGHLPSQIKLSQIYFGLAQDTANKLLDESSTSSVSTEELKNSTYYDDISKSVTWLKKGISKGSREARDELFNIYFQLGESSKALSVVIEDAESGDAEAQYKACLIYLKKIKRASAVENWCSLAAEAGHPRAQLDLSKFYMKRAYGNYRWEYLESINNKDNWWMKGWWKASKGKSVTGDKDKAFSWAKQAAASGLPEAQYYLCKQYFFARDEKELGLAWCEKSAAKDYERAVSFLKNPYFYNPTDTPLGSGPPSYW